MRHTFASRLLRAGTDIKEISELLGHEKVSTTYDLYIHLIEPGTKAASVSILNSDVKLVTELPENRVRAPQKQRVSRLKK